MSSHFSHKNNTRHKSKNRRSNHENDGRPLNPNITIDPVPVGFDQNRILHFLGWRSISIANVASLVFWLFVVAFVVFIIVALNSSFEGRFKIIPLSFGSVTTSIDK